MPAISTDWLALRIGALVFFQHFRFVRIYFLNQTSRTGVWQSAAPTQHKLGKRRNKSKAWNDWWNRGPRSQVSNDESPHPTQPDWPERESSVPQKKLLIIIQSLSPRRLINCNTGSGNVLKEQNKITINCSQGNFSSGAKHGEILPSLILGQGLNI